MTLQKFTHLTLWGKKLGECQNTNFAHVSETIHHVGVKFGDSRSRCSTNISPVGNLQNGGMPRPEVENDVISCLKV